VSLTLRFEPDFGADAAGNSIADGGVGRYSLVMGCPALANQLLTAIKSRCDGKL
jgi:hypothetical protein